MEIRDIIKFIYINEIEWHWFDDNGRGNVVIFVNDIMLSDFRNVLSASDYDDEGLEIILKDNYFCIKMNDLCENNDIDITDIFSLNENNELIRHLDL